MNKYSNKEIYSDARWKELFAFGKDLFMKEWNRLMKYSSEGNTSKFRVRIYKEEKNE